MSEVQNGGQGHLAPGAAHTPGGQHHLENAALHVVGNQQILAHHCGQGELRTGGRLQDAQRTALRRPD